MSGVNFDRQSATLIAETVQRVRGFTPSINPGGPQVSERSRPVLCGILIDDLEPATHPRLGATAARVRCYGLDATRPASYPTPRVPLLTERVEWVVNRDIDAEATAGTYVVIEWTALGEWHWIVLGCSPACDGGSVDWTADGTQWNQDIDTVGGNQCSDGCFAPEPTDPPTLPGATATTDCVDEALEGYTE